MSKLLLTYYGDDFTGSTDAMEQLTLAGIRTALFIEPPTQKQLARFGNLQAVGVAGMTRSMTPDAMERELRPAFRKLKALGSRHIHYKICSTFDSSPKTGSIGKVIDLGTDIFRSKFVPLLVAAPALGRYCIFGNLFARYGIGSAGAIHRLDRHPSISRHPVTPMTESDLQLHLGKQTRKSIALFDIQKVALAPAQARNELKRLLHGKPNIVLFDALYQEQLKLIGHLIDGHATGRQPLFSVGSSGIEMALGAHWNNPRCQLKPAEKANRILVGSGSCSPVTSRQIEWALKNEFAEVAIDAAAIVSGAPATLKMKPETRHLVSYRNLENPASLEIQRAIKVASSHLRNGRSVIVHTTRTGANKGIATRFKNNTASVLGRALGEVLRGALEQSNVHRICIAGGDTSGHAARALGIDALEMIASLTPGAPLCRAHAPESAIDGCEVFFKGGQVGSEDYFGIVLKGKR
jgi:uncharacterized protein YgbK (DUF1537 family)